MKWVVVTVITLFFLLLGVRLLRRFMLGQATVHIGHMKSEADASQVAHVLKELRGVVEARVDLEGHLVRVTYRKGKIAVEDIMRALHVAGY